MVVDGSFGDIGLLGSPIQLTVRDGKLVDIQGQDADKLSVLRESEANATLCELGIGANYAARLRGILLEDEKAYHTTMRPLVPTMISEAPTRPPAIWTVL